MNHSVYGVSEIILLFCKVVGNLSRISIVKHVDKISHILDNRHFRPVQHGNQIDKYRLDVTMTFVVEIFLNLNFFQFICH